MSTRLVQIGHIGVVARDDESLKTIGLGSCVAVVILDAVRRVAGMAHVVLPASTPEDAANGKPDGYYADLAIPKLLEQLAKHGTSPKTGPITVKIIGGATTGNNSSTYNIGKRNVLAVKKTLWRHGMTPVVEETGGTDARTVTVEAGTQRVVVTTPNKDPQEL